MTTFQYNQDLLDACAASSLIRASASGNGFDQEKVPVAPCYDLFRQHATHYNRDMLETERQIAAGRGERLDAFLNSVRYLAAHDTIDFDVTLNQFSDQPVHKIFSMSEEEEDGDVDGSPHHRHLFLKKEVLQENENIDIDYVDLSDENALLQHMSLLGIGHGSMNVLTPKDDGRKRDDYEPETVLRIPDSNDDEQPFTPNVPTPPDGVLLAIRANRAYKSSKAKKKEQINNRDDDSQDDDSNGSDPFEIHLNWATDNNPDGVAIVNPAIDQGSCGSCWALSATGSLEASAARREAHDAYLDYIFTRRSEANATQFAQLIEQKSMHMLNLSIQELLDCDTAADQGCTGGNPLLAFYFIHRYGLAHWQAYPYIGYQDTTCHKSMMRNPVATVQSWGILSSNHENHMELVLRYIGPIAVGVNGAHPAFLSYRQGIFHVNNCKQGANHALLVTGYGQEVDSESGNVTKYWIARNSWGPHWGENGFVRVRRNLHGYQGLPGLCGIARSPSVALGGMLLPPYAYSEKSSVFGMRSSNENATDYDNDVGSLQVTCVRLGLRLDGSCGHAMRWLELHTALLLGCLGVFMALLAIWPLSADCRRRRRVRRMRRLKREELERQKELSQQNFVEEGMPLLEETTTGANYGAAQSKDYEVHEPLN